MLKFTVPGEPRPWERARQSGSRRFNSSEMTAAKATIAQYADLAIRETHRSLEYPMAGNFSVICTFVLGYRRRSNPDLDNFCKIFLDAANGVVWHDDCQVVSLLARKLRGCSPCTEVEIIHETELSQCHRTGNQETRNSFHAGISARVRQPIGTAMTDKLKAKQAQLFREEVLGCPQG